MTRKDYVPIAAILRQAQHKDDPRTYIANAIAALMEHDNSRFKRDVFLDAAECEDTGVAIV
jgi:hypothetical protein